MGFRKAAGAVLMAASLLFATAGSTSAALAQTTANQADADFVMMMIPHHHQALIMSGLVEERGSDEEVRALAERIQVEQDAEIAMMQSWQSRNGFEVTDAEAAYQELLQDPAMLEQMGMATQAELDDLSASQGTAADVLFLQLMIEHHQGAVDMLIDVITNGSDPQLQEWALDMLSTQSVEIDMMEEMLDRLS